MSDESLEESIAKLNKALDAAKEDLVRGPAMRIEDLTEMANQYLNDKTKQDMSRKATNIIEVTDEKSYKAIYFGFITRRSNIESGVKKLAVILNDLSDRKLIHSCLSPVSSVELVRTFGRVPANIVLSYVLVPSEHYDELNREYVDSVLVEGGMPNESENLNIDLPDGEFLADIRVSATMARDSVGGNYLLSKEIREYLKALPEGTQVKEVIELGVVDLSLPYEVRFYNPLLQKIKRVDLDYMRSVAVVEGKLEQFNLFLGIRYFDKDNKELYKRVFSYE